MNPVGGSKIFIGLRVASKPEVTASDFVGQDWVEIGGLTNIGQLGDSQEVVSQSVISGGRTRQTKGTVVGQVMENTFLPIWNDPGQARFLAAVKSCHTYAFKVEWSQGCEDDPVVDMFYGLALPGSRAGGDANAVQLRNGSIAVDSNVVEVGGPLVSPYELPSLVPCVIEGLAQRATATAYVEGAFVAQNATVLRCIKAGTSSGSSSISLAEPDYVTDNSCIWAVFGYIAPVAFANNLTLVLGQLFASAGMLFRVTAAGTTHASNAGPVTPTAGTNGTVGFTYEGPQELPIMSVAIEGAPSGSFVARAGWSGGNLSPNSIVKGGTIIPSVNVNPTTLGLIVSASADGVSPYSVNDFGGGSLLYQSDAPISYLRTYNYDPGSLHWADGKVVAFTVSSVQFQGRNYRLDASGLPRALRKVRHKISTTLHINSVFATASDTVAAWGGYSAKKAVIVGDSFYERISTGTGGWIGDMLGIEDWRVAASGGTGVLRASTSPNRVNFVNRWTQDVIEHQPDLVVLALSGNDPGGIPGSYSTQDVINAVGALIDRSIREIRAEVIVIGMWNNRAPLTSGVAYDIDIGVEALCAAKSVPYIKIRDLLTDGGFVGSPSGTGNSKTLTGADGIHPSVPFGQRFRADYITPRIARASIVT